MDIVELLQAELDSDDNDWTDDRIIYFTGWLCDGRMRNLSGAKFVAALLQHPDWLRSMWAQFILEQDE